ncbi:MAG: hypothetical protein EHM58_06375 [Ignavibacteriae bacterium]|nr:MAG: hypothetical protein EHM58_06375 [Ignavibacteriota bacterium]
MKKLFGLLIAFALLSAIFYYSDVNNSVAADKAGCEAYIYIANNSMFECDLSIDGVGIGTLLVGKNKTYKVELLNDTPKKIKVKISYLNPDYIEPKSYYLLTKTKLECGQSDSMYIAHTN